jgi:chorismate--pyruvate lyase
MYKQENQWLDFSWRPAEELLVSSVPLAISERLLAPGSLTCYIEQYAQESFRVEVINSGWFYPKPSEAAALGILAREKAWVREVFLRCDNKIWVYAWSVFPQTTLAGKYKSLQRLGNKSLGKILFSQSEVQRSAFEIVQIPSDNPVYQKVMREETTKPPILWARRSCFRCADKPLLVSEVFLPGAFKLS